MPRQKSAETGRYGHQSDRKARSLTRNPRTLSLWGHPPYNEKDGDLLDLVKRAKFSFPASTWKAVSPEAQELVPVRKLMIVDVEARYDGAQVLQHARMQSK